MQRGGGRGGAGGRGGQGGGVGGRGGPRGGGGYDGGSRGGGGGGGPRGGQGGGYRGGGGRGDGGLSRDFGQMGMGGGGGRGGDRGGRGGDRGFRGGGGRSRTVVKFEQRANTPAYRNEPAPPVRIVTGWKTSFTADPEQLNVLPVRKPDSGLKNYNREVPIVLNHFPLSIKFPKIMYQYRVDFDRIRRPAAESGDGPKKDQDTKKKKGKGGGRGGGGGGGGDGGAGPGQGTRLPGDLIKRIMRNVLRKMWTEYGRHGTFGIISDFSHALYTVRRLEEAPIGLEWTVNGADVAEDEEGSTFRVRISATTERVNTANLAFDINNMRNQAVTGDLINLERIYSVLIRCVEVNRYTAMRRTELVDYTVAPHPLGGGVVSYPGFTALLPLANGWKPFLNIEIANLATYMNGPVLNVLQDVLGRSPPNDITKWQRGDLEKANDLLKTCKVTYKPQPGRIFSKVVTQVCRTSVSLTLFDYQGRRISVYDYFTQILRVPLQHKNGPCLECKGNNRPKIPAEICTLKSGQSFNRKLNDTQTTSIAEVARKAPRELQPAIGQAVQALSLLNNDILKAYGVQMQNNGKMHEVKARVLAPPELCYGGKPGERSNTKAVIVPDNGEWDIWGTEFEFYRNATVVNWALVNLSAKAYRGAYQDTCWEFADGLIRKAKTRGMQLPEPLMYEELDLRDFAEQRDTNVEQLTKVFKKIKAAFKEEKRSFVLVAVPKKGCQVYNHVKQAAELNVGILTQCIAGSNMGDPRRLDSILGNVLLKINSKLTHVNHVILPPPNLDAKCFPIFTYPTMIIGADVTHPPPGSTRIEVDKDGNEVEIGPPSFAAITASICRTGMPYMMHIQAQRKAGKGAAEVITGLRDIVRKFMFAYRGFTGGPKGVTPQKIIYFRDGVGDGQFQEVLRTEMNAIREACQSLNKEYQPRITFITVQKRHKTRFFLPLNNSHENAPPGTVVDTDIVHPVENDFYLLSHKGLLGTSRPTRYHVLWDDSDFSMNEIQTMAYYLCYMFVRCNRSVKIPAPTYYAHWAAKRAEILSKGWVENYYDNIPELNRQLLQREGEFSQTYPMHFV